MRRAWWELGKAKQGERWKERIEIAAEIEGKNRALVVGIETIPKPNGRRMTPPMRRACGVGKEDGERDMKDWKIETRNWKVEIGNLRLNT
jgi:hypothetical protein